jgi:hypothetical protein
MFAYIVMSYDNPQLISRLAHRIRKSSPDAAIVLRHDSRRCQLPEDLPTGAYLRPSSRSIEWGHWSMVEATLSELAWVKENIAPSHVVIISGQDYPVRPLAQWEESSTHLDGIVQAHPLDFTSRWGRRRGYVGDETMVRYGYRWFGIPGSSRWTYAHRPAKFGNKVAFRLISNIRPAAYYRTLPHGRGTLVGIRRRWKGPQPYKGWPWMMLSARAVNYVLDSNLAPLFKRALIPEEGYIQTVVFNCPLKIRISAITYSSWAQELGISHPRVLDESDFNDIVRCQYPFARKVLTSPLLDAMDRVNVNPNVVAVKTPGRSGTAEINPP